MSPPGTTAGGRGAFVVSQYVGTVGGGALAPLLLCRELVALGYEVTAFTHHLNVPGGENAAGFRASGRVAAGTFPNVFSPSR